MSANTFLNGFLILLRIQKPIAGATLVPPIAIVAVLKFGGWWGGDIDDVELPGFDDRGRSAGEEFPEIIVRLKWPLMKLRRQSAECRVLRRKSVQCWGRNQSGLACCGWFC
jgi:hypothetical protein